MLQHSNSQPTQSIHRNLILSPASSNNNSIDSIDFALQLSRQESMAGAGRSNNGSSNSHRTPGASRQNNVTGAARDYLDVRPEQLLTLTGMGFSAEASVQALRKKNYDVNEALEFLLSV